MDAERLRRSLEVIGVNMSSKRSGQRISQRAVAKEIGGSQSRVSRWEKGASSPRLADFLSYADAIHARPEALIAGALTGSVEQMSNELDTEAGAVVTDLVRILHERRRTTTAETMSRATDERLKSS